MTHGALLPTSAVLVAIGCLCAHGSASAAPQAECPAEPSASKPRAGCSESVSDTGGLCVRAPASLLLAIAADGSASGVQKVCNDSTKAVKPELALSAFSTGPCFATPVLGELPDVQLDAAAKAKLDSSGELPAGACIDVAVRASKLNQPGLMSADLTSGRMTIARIRALQTKPSFDLKVEGATADQLSIVLTKGETSHIRVRNADPASYRFRWRVDLGHYSAEDVQWIPPFGEVTIPITVDPTCASDCAPSQIGFFDSGFLSSGMMTGRLLLAYEPDSALAHLADLPRRTTQLRARTNFWGRYWQGLWNGAFVLFALMAGIGTSLLVNYALPTQRKRITTKEALVELEGRLIGLSNFVESRTLGLLRSEKRRIGAELRTLSPFLPDTETALPALQGRLATLARRIDLTVKAGNLLRQSRAASDLADPERGAIAAHCRIVLDQARKPAADEADFKTADAQLVFAAQVLSAAGQAPSPEAIDALHKRADALPAALAADSDDVDAKAFWKSLHGLLQAIVKNLPRSWDLQRQDFVRVCGAVVKAEHIVRFKAFVDESSDDELRQRRRDRADDLGKALLPGDEESAERAEQILQQVEEGVGAADLATELTANASRLCIDVDPPTPLPRQLVTFRVVMPKAGQNTSVARRELACTWRLDGQPLSEPQGWTWSTYFEPRKWPRPTSWGEVGSRIRRMLLPFGPPAPSPAPFQVEAVLQFPGGSTLAPIAAPPVHLEVLKSYVAGRTTYAVFTLLITVLLVGIGLLATAQEKLQTADWLTGLGVVFALGFGAEALKRVLTRT